MCRDTPWSGINNPQLFSAGLILSSFILYSLAILGKLPTTVYNTVLMSFEIGMHCIYPPGGIDAQYTELVPSWSMVME